MVLLIDERPEEVKTQRSVKGEVVASTFDEPAHGQGCGNGSEKAKDSRAQKRCCNLIRFITRLGRVYNAVIPSSGKVLTGGVDANALQRPKDFLEPPEM